MNVDLAAASEWYDEAEKARALLPDHVEAYLRLGRIFIRIIGEYTADTDILLAGTFAKTDYLLKSRGADAGLRRSVNDLRQRVTRRTETQTFGSFMADFRALCLFIALLTGSEVPGGIASRFPTLPGDGLSDASHIRRPADVLSHATGEGEGVFGSQPKEEYLRVVVNAWDDDFIYCTDDISGMELRVCYSADGHPNKGSDHSYIRDMLYKGVMLNLIRPRTMAGGMLYPEFIILDPDYLVDVSTVVSCFDSYAESPLLALVKRLEPFRPTEPILLGNMAGELLDEVLHSRDIPSALPLSTQLQNAYRRTAGTFFRRHAMSIMCLQPSLDFHRKAWQQFMNIRSAMLRTLPQQVPGYDPQHVVVEPTFFSEMLGLQGRMDMLQRDMRVLVEQKSGKGGFAPRHDDAATPVHTEQHYMQMLLYMAIIRYNFRRAYDASGGRLYAFLLYSRYARPLIGLGFSPQLLFAALKMRNAYVAQERSMTLGGMRSVMQMHGEDFNQKGATGCLWHDYQLPRIERILAPFRSATPLASAYVERFYRFVALEHRLSKVGNQSKENSGFASAWLSSADEKIQGGDMLSELLILPPAPSDGYIEMLTLFTDGETGNFRSGDIVVLYSHRHGQVPDLRRVMSFRATIVEVTPAEITVRLRNAQRDAEMFGEREGVRWCLEHDFMESSYSGLYRGLYAFLSAPAERRELLLMQRPPRLSLHRPLRGEYGDFNDLQQRVKDAGDLFLIIGPPGTGKTSFGMLNTLQEELLEPNSRVLIVSYTNRAVDEICSKLHPRIPFLRIGGEASASPAYADNMFSALVSRAASAADLRAAVSATRVIVGTTSAVSAHLPILAMGFFSLCIVDEAGQILEPHLLPLLSLSCEGRTCIRKFVMIGDHKQLPAVVQQRPRESEVRDKELNAIGLTDCRNSLFERLLRAYCHDPRFCYMLTRQGRMHPDIARFPNIAFYGGLLVAVPLPHQLAASPSPRVQFVDVSPFPDSPSDKVNLAEAEAVVDRLLSIWQDTRETFIPADTVGVIVPYRNQISAIRTLLAERLGDLQHPLLSITIDTVERYQGSQRNYIIYAFTVSRRYQLRFLTETTFHEDGMTIDRKLNVVMTRALDYLVLIGNSSLLSLCPLYRNLLQYIADGILPGAKG